MAGKTEAWSCGWTTVDLNKERPGPSRFRCHPWLTPESRTIRISLDHVSFSEITSASSIRVPAAREHFPRGPREVGGGVPNGCCQAPPCCGRTVVSNKVLSVQGYACPSPYCPWLVQFSCGLWDHCMICRTINAESSVCVEEQQDQPGLWQSMERSRMAQSSHSRVTEHRPEPEFQLILRSVNVGLTLTPDLIQAKLSLWQNQDYDCPMSAMIPISPWLLTTSCMEVETGGLFVPSWLGLNVTPCQTLGKCKETGNVSRTGRCGTEGGCSLGLCCSGRMLKSSIDMGFYLLMFLSKILSDRHGWPYILKRQRFPEHSPLLTVLSRVLPGTVSTRVGRCQWVLSSVPGLHLLLRVRSRPV